MRKEVTFRGRDKMLIRKIENYQKREEMEAVIWR